MNIARKPNAIVIAGALALSLATTAWAGSDTDKHFKKMDADGDGKVTRSEHATAAKKMFKECDANQDGIVTASEMDSAMASKGDKPGQGDKNSAEKIKMIDQNGDGRLTAMEHETGTDTMFARTDKNADGFLTKEECDAAAKMMKKDH